LLAYAFTYLSCSGIRFAARNSGGFKGRFSNFSSGLVNLIVELFCSLGDFLIKQAFAPGNCFTELAFASVSFSSGYPFKSSKKPAVADVRIELMKTNVNPSVSCFIVFPSQKKRGN